MSYLWTTVPFLLFMIVIVWFEKRHKKKESVLHKETDRYLRPVARTTSRMFEKQYGRSSTEMENTFPDIKDPK